MNYKLWEKLFPGDEKKIDTVEDYRESQGNGMQEWRRGDDVLNDAFMAWQALDRFRRVADRNKMYVFEDQWGDVVEYEGCRMKERDAIKMQGNQPITNNRLRGIVRSISGVFQANQTEPLCVARERNAQFKGEIMTQTLQYVYQLNKTWSLDVANLNNFLISGLAAFKTSYGYRNGLFDVWTDNVDYNRIFFDSNMEDVRQWDVSLIGEIEDLSVYDVMSRYSGGDRQKAQRIKQLYIHTDRNRVLSYMDAYNRNHGYYRDFYYADEVSDRCRVITVWRREAKERILVHDMLNGELYKIETEEEEEIALENNRRVAEQTAMGVSLQNLKLLETDFIVDNYWYHYVLTPTGEIIEEGEAKDWHESHPYSIKLYTFYNKNVYPYMSGIIDQQRYVNRLIMMQDFMYRAAAKGLLMIPKQAIEDSGMSPEEFADEWRRFNSVIVYNAKPGIDPPHQITSNSTELGLYDMLQIQLKMLDDESNITNALQGRQPPSGTPAALFSQQAQNSAASLSEIFEFYRMVREERDIKTVKLIQQYYTESKYINSTGKKSYIYNPDEVRNVEFSLSLEESANTPVYRSVMNEMLYNLMSLGKISVVQMLERSSLPFADALIEDIRSSEEQLLTPGPSPNGEGGGDAPVGGGGQGFQIPQDARRQIAEGANPEAMRALGIGG